MDQNFFTHLFALFCCGYVRAGRNAAPNDAAPPSSSPNSHTGRYVPVPSHESPSSPSCSRNSYFRGCEDDMSSVVDPPHPFDDVYLEGGLHDGLEPLGEYTAGGFHPVHLGQYLGEHNRYRVVHKLGFGGFATVWLCRDEVEARYVALKINAAQVYDNPTLELSIPKADFIPEPWDTFTIEGPNGKHRCLVFPLLGPPVSPAIWRKMDLKDVGPRLRNYARQTVEAMRFLHENGICHGDFRAQNILVKLRNLDALSEEELYSVLGRPITVKVRAGQADVVPISFPEYLTHPVDFKDVAFDHKYLSDQISVIDYGVAYQTTKPPQGYAIPSSYWPPEAFLPPPAFEEDADLVDDEHLVQDTVLEYEPIDGVAADLWALGCTLYEIRTQIPMFYMLNDESELLEEMTSYLGKLPEHVWNAWKGNGREDIYNDDGQRVDGRDGEYADYLETMLKVPVTVLVPGADGKNQKKESGLSEEEAYLLADLLRKIMHYDPKKRMGCDDILRHDWFKL